MIVSERIRAVRESKGWNARELAKRTGLSPALISRLESKHRQPRTDTLQKIAAALEVTVSFLLGEEDEDLSLDVALRRQALKKTLKEVSIPDTQRLSFEEMCFKDSAPNSIQLWKDFIENLTFYEREHVHRP